MAKAEVPANVEDDTAPVGYDPAAFEWDLVHEESPDQIVFDTIGDEYTGLYLGSEVITFTKQVKGEDVDQEFTQHRFRDPGGITVVNGGYELNSELSKIEPNTMLRIRLMKLVDVGQNDPMKSYRIWTARSAANTGA
jgi:hypothetical protein